MTGMDRRISPGLPLPRNGMKPNAPEIISWPLMDPADLVETHGSGHIHWTVTAFHHVDEQGAFSDACSVDVEAKTEPEAIARAQELISRANYRVSSVREVCTLDEAIARRAQ